MTPTIMPEKRAINENVKEDEQLSKKFKLESNNSNNNNNNENQKQKQTQNQNSKQKNQQQTKKHKTRKYKAKTVELTSPLGVLDLEIKSLCEEYNLTLDEIRNDMRGILNDTTVEQVYHRIVEDVEILKFASNGDSIAIVSIPQSDNKAIEMTKDSTKENADKHAVLPLQKKQVVIIPFGIPGDIAKIKIFRTHPLYAEADLLAITKPSGIRNDNLINCRYFGKCSGCQYQNIHYDEQLEIKKQTIRNAYKHFAPILSEKGLLPDVDDTEASPLQYQYRTKLTPHFNIAKGYGKTGKELEHRPNFGFGAKGRPEWRTGEKAKEGRIGADFGSLGQIMDIEECTIGTKIVNIGLENERHRFENAFKEYKRGATVLLREDTKCMQNVVKNTGDATNTDEVKNDAKESVIGEASRDELGEVSSIKVEQDDQEVVKTCVTNPRQIVQEIIGPYRFEFSAGEFFQNNNSILPIITKYVRDNLFSNSTNTITNTTTNTTTTTTNTGSSSPNYLVDAYCGSGLFSITCSTNVTKVIGVEVSADSVKFARHNAKLNNIKNSHFIVGKAEEIFKDIDTPSEQTSVILDPPRKGCDDVFLNQLSEYKPAKIVYISCNVHSQARDVEWFLNNTKNGELYKVESIKGFDFFPQTHHVESVAVLSMK